MWWALQTVTTVGYGDVVPTTAAGRGVASLLLLGGLALISVVTATITSGFVARAQQERADTGQDPALQELAALNARLAPSTTGSPASKRASSAFSSELASNHAAEPPGSG